MEHEHKGFARELSDLGARVAQMGKLVLEQLESAMGYLAAQDIRGARIISERDASVNRMDIELEEVCLQLLALHQPVASDLRLITAAMKITTELERIGDRVVNICEAVSDREAQDSIPVDAEVLRLGELAATMVRTAMEAFSATDRAAAMRVMEIDREFDALYSSAFPRLLTELAQGPMPAARDAKVALLAKDLNEVSEHATNIAEMVLFMVGGKEIMHMDMHERRASRQGQG